MPAVFRKKWGPAARVPFGRGCGAGVRALTRLGTSSCARRAFPAGSGRVCGRAQALSAARSTNRGRPCPSRRAATCQGAIVTTDTGVRATFDWNRLSLSQRGRDTDRIDALYRVHYLQWTGVVWLDKVLGGLGLVLVVALSAFGMRLLFRRNA